MIVNIAYCIGNCLVRRVLYYSHIVSIKSLVEWMLQRYHIQVICRFYISSMHKQTIVLAVNVFGFYYLGETPYANMAQSSIMSQIISGYRLPTPEYASEEM